MTEHNKVHISALMDGELDGIEIDSLLKDRAMKACWHRYHIISDVIQNRPPVPDTQLAARISELIKNEPTILAPVRKPVSGYLRPAAGIAVAASVATLAILGVQQYQARSISQPARAIAAVATPVVQPQGPIDRVEAQPVLVVNSSIMPVTQPAIQVQPYSRNSPNPRISRYILNHNEYQSNAGVHGVTPHVRMVATDGK